ncbi:MAG: hypothetical protein GC191_06160 [Azospirillum sp.]|nr:hypothetical protein [Azospirillum sp.]
MDQKTVFDAGYRSYEDGNRERDFDAGVVAWTDKAQFAALWCDGWQRAKQDSVLLRYHAKRPSRVRPRLERADAGRPCA